MYALSLEQAWSKPKTLIITTVIGLSWFVMAIASYSVARALFPHSLRGELIFANASLIVLGYTLYLFGVPLLFDSRRDLLSFWRRIGFFYFDRKSVVMFSLFVILTLIIGVASGCVFRSKPATGSGKFQPPNPLNSSHPFRLMSATESGK